MQISKNITIREIIPFDLQRKVVSHITSSSWKNVPLVTYLYEPDVTDFYAEYQKRSAQVNQNVSKSSKLSLNTLLLKTIVEGLLVAPKLNSLLEYNPRTVKGQLLVCADINISIPWLLADGRMITPILTKAEKMSLNELTTAVALLGKKIGNTNVDEMLYRSARKDTFGEMKQFNPRILSRILSAGIGNQKLTHLRGEEKKRYYNTPEESRLTERDIMDGTVTVSNIGTLYREQRGNFGLLEVIPPQVFAVGISAVQVKPGIVMDRDGNQQIGIRKYLPMCLAFDHRAFDFDTLIPFLKRLDDIFTHPDEMHNW
jgi:pyruvate dehydrogenase E2 component (dihydrolipoamide acetyltransferase)